MYQERRSRFPGGVLWHRPFQVRPGREPSGPGPAEATVRVLPDGCMDLIWVGGRLLVAGPDTRAQLAPVRPDTAYTGLRFGPGTAAALLGLPACELRDRRVPLADLWPAARVRRLTDQIEAAPDPGTALEAVAAYLLSRAEPADPAVPAMVARARAGAPIPETAEALGLSDRQLRRRSLAAFGYPPKTLARILRLNRALDLARAGLPFADVAADTGYADQAHFARDVKALAGVPLGTLVTGGRRPDR